MLNPIYEARYGKVFLALREKLKSVRVAACSIIPLEQTCPSEGTISLWELLEEQDKFISGIMGMFASFART